MRLTIPRLLVMCLFLYPLGAVSQSTAPEDAEAYIISPQDGDRVQNPVTVVFGLRNFGVAPAGVQRENTGHHHLMIDIEGTPPDSEPIPNDDNHRHFGGGQTQTTIELEPGAHTLQLLMGDHAHIPHEPPVISDLITITVEE